jgi:hypothetical protein
MQIDISTALGFLATVISVAVGAWFATARYAISQREREIDRRLDDCRDELRKLNERLHTEEKATIRQDGDVARVRDSHGTLLCDIEEIKKSMVTKSEFLVLERTLTQILTEMQRTRSGSSYQSISSGPPKKLDPR